jgi:beta-lactamase superfamily II metal-dependent hydrolase
LLSLIVVQAEYGDCMLLESDATNVKSYILIDGGPSQTYKRYLRPTIERFVKNRKLDLVVLSHIDNDHISGLLDLLEEIKNQKEGNQNIIVRIEDMWHNSFKDLLQMDKQTVAFVKGILRSHLGAMSSVDTASPVIEPILILKGVSEGIDLADLAKSLRIPANSNFDNTLIVAEDILKPIQIGKIQFHILGPTRKNIQKLKKDWSDWLIRHKDTPVSVLDYAAIKEIDNSVTNRSSIMFIVESEGKKILFTGDGLGSDIVDVLSEKQMLNSEGKLHVNILKVPHHGSERNVSEEFFGIITADTYVISANGRDDNPSLSTLKWIIESAGGKLSEIEIVATNVTPNIEKIIQEYPEQKFNYKFRFIKEGDDYVTLELK